MLQTWNAKMDFKKDLIADVKTKEETFDVCHLGPQSPSTRHPPVSASLLQLLMTTELLQQCQCPSPPIPHRRLYLSLPRPFHLYPPIRPLAQLLHARSATRHASPLGATRLPPRPLRLVQYPCRPKRPARPRRQDQRLHRHARQSVQPRARARRRRVGDAHVAHVRPGRRAGV